MPPQIPSEKAVADYYGQNEEVKPIPQPAVNAEEPQPQKAELVSHSTPSLLKRMLLPKLAK